MGKWEAKMKSGGRDAKEFCPAGRWCVLKNLSGCSNICPGGGGERK